MPPGSKIPEFDIKIEASSLTVGIKGNPPFIKEALFSKVLVDESFWMIEDDELHIALAKMKRAEMWEMALQGHKSMDPLMQEEIKKKLLMERF